MKWPSGVRSAGVACGIKSTGSDLGILVFDEGSVWAGTFTTNAAAAAPVRWCRDQVGDQMRALVVNSGNANACTGSAGHAAVLKVASEAAVSVGCQPTEVAIASTGPIGVQLPVDRIVGALPEALSHLSESCTAFAGSILTTDTHMKISEAVAGEARVVGVAKGAAMIAPNMATMLAFIVTDASVTRSQAATILTSAVDHSFNRISVDACESTNDSVFLVATGHIEVSEAAFAAAVTTVCADLAEQIVRDAEGGTKLMRIRIDGARDDAHAAALGHSVAASDLWRAAVNGEDPNWGRVLSALGACDRSLSLDQIELSIGSEIVFDRGEPTGALEIAAKVMAEDEFTITCLVGPGGGSAEILSVDLSTEYVALNSEIST